MSRPLPTQVLVAWLPRLCRAVGLDWLLLVLMMASGIVQAAVQVTIAGPGGERQQSVPDTGGAFNVDLPLNKNAVNNIQVTARDSQGRVATKELRITQLSLSNIVVAQVQTRPLSVPEIQQLVNDGVISLADPANFNVSQFDIILTIDHRPVPVSIPIVMGPQEITGYEVYQIPQDAGGSGAPPPPPPDTIVVFEVVPPGPPGMPPPPPIPGVMVIEGKIRSLKEFFSARLILMNISGIFTLHDVSAQIEFPDGGLSATLPADGIVSFGDILPGTAEAPGQADREFIIRGDEIGVRGVKINFGGTLIGPGLPDDPPIAFNGSALGQVEIKGPPTFLVQVQHPDEVTAGNPYDLTVNITNTGQAPALYASLEFDVGFMGELLDCKVNTTTLATECSTVTGSLTRQLGDIYPGQTASQTFRINPLVSGVISSCLGISDQNITLQVSVGDQGCLAGHFPPDRAALENLPTVSMAPAANMTGISIDSPIAAFFSRPMSLGTISLGESGSFRVYDSSGQIVPGIINFDQINGNTVGIWQVNDGITNRLQPDREYTVIISRDCRDLSGNQLTSQWTSKFTTTNPFDDHDAPQLTLGILPPTNPNAVLPGEIVRVNAFASDAGSGVARVQLRIRDLDTSGSLFQLIDQKQATTSQTLPNIFALDSGKLIPGHSYALKATAYDKIGNQREATLTLVLTQTAPKPAFQLVNEPAGPVAQGAMLNIVPLSVSTGVRRFDYYLDGQSTVSQSQLLAPYQYLLDTLHLQPGQHAVRAVAVDGLEQTTETLWHFELVAGDTKPSAQFIGLSDGVQVIVGHKLTIIGQATDPVGIDSIQFRLDAPNGALLASSADPFLLDTTGLALGTHHVYLIATNRLGVQNDVADAVSILDFEVVETPAGPPPAAPIVTNITSPTGGATTITGTAAPGATINATNLQLGLNLSTIAAGNGAFNVAMDAEAGNTIRLTATLLSQSITPSAPTDVTVPEAFVLTSISVDPNVLNFTLAGSYADLQVTGHYSNGSAQNLTAQSTFLSGNIAIAGVNAAGRVAPMQNGNTSIQVASGGQNFNVPVTVNIVTLTSISVSPTSVTLTTPGQQVQLAVMGHYSDGSQQPISSGVIFASGDLNVAAVNSAGLVTAMGNGVTQVSTTFASLIPAACTITVATALDTPPDVGITGPADGTLVEPGSNISIQVQASDAVGGVKQVHFSATGAATGSDLRQLAPAVALTNQTFVVAVPANAPPGGTITVSAWATDSGNQNSPIRTITLTVADLTAPTGVLITAPASQTKYNFGDTVSLSVQATDNVGVSEFTYQTTGALQLSGSFVVTPALKNAAHTFNFQIPFNVLRSDLQLRAFALDAAGHVAASVPVNVVITDADITPPATIATGASNPSSGATATVSYQVTAGLADLDHVELYFRRNGHGTFNRYTSLAVPDGKFHPQTGASGTIIFDSTRMGGDGGYEFHTVGIDLVGNREAAPLDASSKPTGDPGAAAGFNTGAEVITIATDQEISDFSLENKNLRIDGKWVTVVGAHSFHNVELLNGAVLTHRETSAVSEEQLNLTVWTMTLDSTSKIDLIGRGYQGGLTSSAPGKTQGNVDGSSQGAGGSHGGLGGSYSGGVPAPVYDDLTNPQNSGGGGGNWFGTLGGDGGGRLLLNAVNLVVDGTIRADGAISAGSAAGNGAGGALNIKTRTLSGLGSLSANGPAQNTGVAAGGGRIAIQYLDLANANLAGITAAGGIGFYGTPGANGTVFLKQEDQSSGELVIEGRVGDQTFTNLIIPTGIAFDNLTLRNNARVITTDPIHVRDRVLVTGNSVLTHATSDPNGLLIEARNVQVDAGSAIDASTRGFLGGQASSAPGITLGGLAGSTQGAGGSYGGHGAQYDQATDGPIYGDFKNPVLLGSGGANWFGSVGGNGGGRITIVTSDSLVIDGALRADGGVANSAGGNGSGGSVLIRTKRLAGSGNISANGGGQNNGVAGGGGRIAIYTDYVDLNQNFNQLRGITAWPGDGFYETKAPSAGTVFIRTANQGVGDLIIDGGMTGATSARPTDLQLCGFGAAAAVTANALQVSPNLPAMLPAAFIGLRLNPDVLQNETFLITGNTTQGLTVTSPNENGKAFAAIAGIGKTYALQYVVDNLRFRRGGHLVTGDLLQVNDTLDLTDFSNLAHPTATRTYEPRLNLNIGTLRIDSGSRIDLSGLGYEGGRSSGEAGRTLGNTAGSSQGSGGSHGGLGGIYSDGIPAHLYDGLTDPAELGGGGGNWFGANGGNGGGRLLLVADQIQVDGAILANGQVVGNAAGYGAGGALNIQTGSISGSGSIRANGGGSNSGVGGGGGRIALRYSGSLTLSENQIEALGGQGFYGSRGGLGTVFIKRPGQTNGELVVDGGNQPPGADTTFLPGGLLFDSLTLRNGARVTADEGLALSGRLWITSNSQLMHSAGLEAGLQITANEVRIDAGSAINVNGRGYRGGLSNNESGRTLGNQPGSTRGSGGSYGGVGAIYAGSGGVPAASYGDLKNPTSLGSGGANYDGNVGAAGGGYVHIITNLMTLNGEVLANGNVAGSAAGDGSGGTINIQAATINGTGNLRANGGGSNSGVGGGGGRIGLRITAALNLPDGNIESLGGQGFYGTHAGPGTIYTRIGAQPNGNLLIDGQGQANVIESTFIPGGLIFDNITLRNAVRVTANAGLSIAAKLWLSGNSILAHSPMLDTGLTIGAATIQVDAGSAIDTTGRGYPGGLSYNGAGHTLFDQAGSTRGSGGSHGGAGGVYAGVPGLVYGDPLNPTRLGGGGANYEGNGGGAGGGRITLNVSGTLLVNGALRADGALSVGSAAGNGAGGSILVHAGTLNGTGIISADGPGNNAQVGGGGGRIALYTNQLTSGAFNNLLGITALGGQGFYGSRGGTGTVLINVNHQPIGDLYIDAGIVDGNGNPMATSSRATELSLTGFSVTAATTANSITLDGKIPLLPGALIGLRVNPDVLQAETFQITSNTAQRIAVISPNENGKTFGSIAATSKTVALDYTFDNLYFRRGGYLQTGDLLTVKHVADLAQYARLTHPEATRSYEPQLNLNAETLNIDATSGIDVSGRGYEGGRSDNETGLTLGNTSGSTRGAGGGHGGLGGSFGGGVSNSSYDSVENPVALGSGGSNYDGNQGGDGGGRIFITASSINCSGLIAADGGRAAGSAAGNGAGGTLNIITGTLAGAGTLRANGYGASANVGGGGGRVTLRYSVSRSIPDARIEALGGQGFYGTAGGHGTVYLNGPADPNGTILIGGGNGLPKTFSTEAGNAPRAWTPLLAPLSAGKLILQNGAQAYAGASLTLTGAINVLQQSRLAHHPGLASGLQITANSAWIDATSAIDVTGCGYEGGRAPLAAGRTVTKEAGAAAGAGGSHAGRGGQLGAGATNRTYGSRLSPLTLGSGGGAGQTDLGGSGGGLVYLIANSLQLDGRICADGQEAGASAGGGSGGSINLRLGSLSGAGLLSAQGGAGGAGGGGGRIFVKTSSLTKQFGNVLTTCTGGQATLASGGYGIVQFDTGGPIAKIEGH